MLLGYLLERHEFSATCIGEQDVDDAGFPANYLIEPVEIG